MANKNKSSAIDKRYEELSSRPGFLIRRLHQIHVGNFLRETHGLNITQVQFGVLNVLDKTGTLDQGSLGAQLGIDRTNVADVVARLEKRNLVKRTTNPADRRSKLVSITPSGEEMARELADAMVAAQDMLVAPLNEKERATLIRILQKLLATHNESARTAFNADLS